MRMKQIETESESEREQKNGWLARFTTINSNSHYTAYKSRFSIQYIAWSSHLWLFLLLFVAVSIQMMFPNKILFAYNLCASGFFCFNARIRGVCWPKFNRSKEKSLKKRGRIRFKANCSQYGGNILLPIRSLYYSAYIDIFQNLIGSKDALGIWWFQKYPKIQHFCDEYLWRVSVSQEQARNFYHYVCVGIFFSCQTRWKMEFGPNKATYLTD